ncbi:hypothetical protein HALLA_12245 [Halostagnicola larsenii XH-48]|uniref:Uncharacterized protein n=1 Tax=Halostagnicola larsenii XH-48 TaxID=797299 RepID=W0JUI6_9EURY|nr:hypothetical protein HALLA_12245 [Halostagnicola larsenii XH-48]
MVRLPLERFGTDLAALVSGELWIIEQFLSAPLTAVDDLRPTVVTCNFDHSLGFVDEVASVVE